VDGGGGVGWDHNFRPNCSVSLFDSLGRSWLIEEYAGEGS
jgi:hypothetical protein